MNGEQYSVWFIARCSVFAKVQIIKKLVVGNFGTIAVRENNVFNLTY